MEQSLPSATKVEKLYPPKLSPIFRKSSSSEVVFFSANDTQVNQVFWRFFLMISKIHTLWWSPLTTYTKTLGVDWNPCSDHFWFTVTELASLENLTKHALVSDIVKTFDVLGWFSPSIVKAIFFLQRCWEQKLDWYNPFSSAIHDVCYSWCSELRLLAEKQNHVVTMTRQGFIWRNWVGGGYKMYTPTSSGHTHFY